MNRIAQLIITLSVSFCAMSCIEKVGTELPDTSDYITVTSEVDMQTKAGYEGTSVLPSSFYMTIKQGSEEGSYTMNRAGSSSNNYNFSGTAPTWKTSDVSQISVKAVTTPSIKINNTTYGYTRNSGSMSVCIDQTTAERVEASDLLGAKTGNGITISGNNINVAFNHLMSKLQVSYKSSLTVSKIELANVAVKGTYSYSNMKHVYSSLSTGTINMFRSANSAEAIFFPFDPAESNVTPELRVYLNGSNEPLVCPIYLKDGARFIPGKLYMMNISISGTTVNNADVTIENWGANANVQIPGERVLWIGTSIPSGHPGIQTSYPEVVDDDMNCTIINNAKPSSYVVPLSFNWNEDFYNLYTDKNGAFEQSIFTAIGCLSLTYQGLKDLHYNRLLEVSNHDEDWATEIITETHRLYSYESLIIPYIDGTKDNCTTVILDHGFNDRGWMYNEAGACMFDDPYTTTGVRGYNFLMDLATGKRTWQDYLDHFAWIESTPPFDKTNIKLGNSYIYRMSQVIQKIKETNPNVRIIIGNYFTTYNPYADTHLNTPDWPDYVRLPRLICANNQALAGIWDLDIVNVQNYIWLDDQSFYEFCPDGTHPWSNPETNRVIADIYINALDGVIGSRVN